MFPAVIADAPEDQHSVPLAPWKVAARDEFGRAQVTLTVFTVTQDGPDEPRVLCQVPVVMDAEQAYLLVESLQAAILFCDDGEA